MSTALLFRARNKQSAASGKPPSIDGNTPGRYHAYFENAQGAQRTFICDREADTGTLYHGDLGWENPQPVEEGGRCSSVVLDDAETLLAFGSLCTPKISMTYRVLVEISTSVIYR